MEILMVGVFSLTIIVEIVDFDRLSKRLSNSLSNARPPPTK